MSVQGGAAGSAGSEVTPFCRQEGRNRSPTAPSGEHGAAMTARVESSHANEGIPSHGFLQGEVCRRRCENEQLGEASPKHNSGKGGNAPLVFGTLRGREAGIGISVQHLESSKNGRRREAASSCGFVLHVLGLHARHPRWSHAPGARTGTNPEDVNAAEQVSRKRSSSCRRSPFDIPQMVKLEARQDHDCHLRASHLRIWSAMK